MNEKKFTVYGLGDAIAYRSKDKRTRARSSHQITPYFIYQNETVQIKLSGEDLGKVEAATGLPELHTRHYYKLAKGINTFTAKGNGILTFVNKNDYGQVEIEILSSPKRLPYFKLNESTETAWKKELTENITAPFVVLSSDLADVVVTSQSARNNITNVKALMMDFDFFLQVQDDTTGVVKNGKADYKTDPNRNLHLESTRSYMFATNEYTGYMGQAAMQRLLRPSNRWGIWHENGHQRQQSSWQWTAGNGMTETTVNIFSLMAQEKTNGRITALNAYYPRIKEFLASTVKNYDTEDFMIKLALFWQLRQAFGEGFYPQLMQRYRLMGSTPGIGDADGQKNLLIRTVSEVVNINMVPFFEKWGIASNNTTLKQLENYPVLQKPLWENIGEDYHTLDMPEKAYIPELIHLRKSISKTSLNNTTATFTIAPDWYSPYRFVIKKNGVWLAEINNGKAYGCSVKIDKNGCHVNCNFTSNTAFQENDLFTIEFYHNDKTHLIFETSIRLIRLWSHVRALFTDSTLKNLKDTVTQAQVENLWQESDTLNAERKIVDALIMAQQLILNKTIASSGFSQNNYSVNFSSDNYRLYSYQAHIDNRTVAEVVNGHAKAPSTINGRTWQFTVGNTISDQITIQASIRGYVFTLVSDSLLEAALRDKINALYLDREKGILRDNVNQTAIDNLAKEIKTPHLAVATQEKLLEALYGVQQYFLENTFSSVTVSATRMVVAFRNADFRNYRYVVRASSGYVSEVANGSAFYSSLNNNNWTTQLTSQQITGMRIEVRRTEKTYVIYRHQTSMLDIIYDEEGMF